MPKTQTQTIPPTQVRQGDVLELGGGNAIVFGTASSYITPECVLVLWLDGEDAGKMRLLEPSQFVMT